MDASRPMPLSRLDDSHERSAVAAVQHGLRYIKYAIAGALGALALGHTVEQFSAVSLSDTADLFFAISGAAVMMAVAKYVRIL